MRNVHKRIGWPLVTLAALGLSSSVGCDATTRATVENGIITASTSLLGAFLRAAIEVAQEDPNTTSAVQGESWLYA